MWRSGTSMWAVLSALTLLLAGGGPAVAQRGGHGGAAVHSGGGVYHGGSYGGGVYHGSPYGGAYHGGYYGGGLYRSYGYGGFYGGIGLTIYPSYGYGYGVASPYLLDSGVSTFDYSTAGGPAVVTRQSAYGTPEQLGAPRQPTTDNRARIRVSLPADAVLWFDDDATQQTGPDRSFVTPPLQPGAVYSYNLRARWTQDGQPVERSLKVDVRANETAVADFNRPTVR